MIFKMYLDESRPFEISEGAAKDPLEKSFLMLVRFSRRLLLELLSIPTRQYMPDL